MSESEEECMERNGWGYLSGDEPRVMDVGALSNAEIAAFLGTPAVALASASLREGERSSVSALGYTPSPWDVGDGGASAPPHYPGVVSGGAAAGSWGLQADRLPPLVRRAVRNPRL